MKYYDQHIHSNYSVDSDEHLETYIKKAIELDLSYFIVTDHLDLDYVEIGNDWTFDVKKQKEELNNLQKKYPNIKLLQGIEIGYKKSALKRIYEYANNYDYDLINLSLHDFNHIDFYYPEIVRKYGVKEILIMYLNELNNAINSFTNYDVVTHLDYCYKTCYLIDNNLKFSEFEPLIIQIMENIIKNDKSLEINLKVQEIVGEEHTKYILDLYKKLGGINITISSDAHKVERYWQNFDHYMKMIKDAGFDHLNYFIERKRYDLSI